MYKSNPETGVPDIESAQYIVIPCENKKLTKFY